jgi:hypothetical protein
LAVAVAIAGFLSLTMAPKSFAAAQANKAGVSFSLSGQYIGKAFWSQNQAQMFANSVSSYTYNDAQIGASPSSTATSNPPTQNTFDVFLQRLRLNASISYDKLAHGMPLAAIFTQFDLTNAYNGVTNGYGTNGWQPLGETTVPGGFNHDFNTFGLRQAYIRFITPIGAIMFGRMPVKFGLGVAVNTNADGIGDFIPLGDTGIFVGNLFGNETTAYNNNTTPTDIGTTPPAVYGYSHIQSGTIPTIEVMSLKPMNNVSWSVWLTEAHLNQFGAALTTLVNGAYSPTTQLSNNSASANITYGGLSATYAAKGTKLAGEFDYFRGEIMNSPYDITGVAPNSMGALEKTTLFNNTTTGDRTKIESYDIYLTGSQLLNTSTPTTLGFKFGIGGPISNDHLDMTYYSQIQNTRTLFGDVIGNNWQPIEFNAPGLNYMYYATGEAMGSNLANRYVIMVDATEHLASGNSLQESLIHAAWLKTSINGTQVFGGSDIGTEFDLNFTHHFTKTLSWQAWGAYVWTGSGVDSTSSSGSATSTCSEYVPAGETCSDVSGAVTYYNGTFSSPNNPTHKDIFALGSAIIWNF